MIRPPSTAPGNEPMPPRTAAVNAFTPGTKPSAKFTTPYCSMYMTPGDGRERRPHDERNGDGAIDIDAEQRRHLAVLLAGALRAAERRLLHQIPEGRQQQCLSPA